MTQCMAYLTNRPNRITEKIMKAAAEQTTTSVSLLSAQHDTVVTKYLTTGRPIGYIMIVY